MITLGGDAELELVNALAPFEDGVVFTVRPPKKSWKNIMNLSGGEKTLSSLALVFALHQYKPTPLYVMDEIDAALGIILYLYIIFLCTNYYFFRFLTCLNISMFSPSFFQFVSIVSSFFNDFRNVNR